MDVKLLIEEFLTESNHSTSTQRNYRSELENFFEFSKMDVLGGDIKLINSLVKDYLEDLEAIYQSNTVNRSLSALKTFFTWIAESKQLLPFNPIYNIKPLIRNDVKKTEVPSEKEVGAILKSFDHTSLRELKYWMGFMLLFILDEESEKVLSLRFKDLERKEFKELQNYSKLIDAIDYYKKKLSEDFQIECSSESFILESEKSKGKHIDRSSFLRELEDKYYSLGLAKRYNVQGCRIFARSSKNVTPDIPMDIGFETDDTVFHSSEEINKYIEELFKKKNVILQGPPGTGKSFLAKKLAELVSHQREENVFQVQMHPSYHYEDFVQGYRPDPQGKLALVDGIFLEICKKAHLAPEHNFVVLIEEINRCDLNQVFGELLHLIDSSKRSKNHGLKLMHQRDAVPFFVPENVFLLATMNTADRSTVHVDYAMKRRFSFLDVKPQFDSENFHKNMIANGFTKKDIEFLKERILKINLEIVKTKHLGEGYLIGHSYFCNDKKNHDVKEWLKMKFDYEIKPLLKEYWYDDLVLITKLTTV